MSILDKFRLNNKTAIVTGASKGIGKAIAKAFAEMGANVVISSRKQEAIAAVTEEFHKEGLEVTPIAAHNGKIQELHELVDKTVAKYGQIDIIVNNAATNPAFGPAIQTDEAVFDKIMQVNVKGAFELCKKAYPELKKRKGNIINIASVVGIRPDNFTAIYSVSKSAIISLTQALAKDWASEGVRVNGICPGLIQTKMSEALWKNEQIHQQLLSTIPLNRMGQPDEIAGLALFLASEAASYCTGGIYVADGGMIV